MKYLIKNKKGFTLIEILVTLVAMTILFGVGAQVLNTTMLSWNMVTLRKGMLYNGRLGMTRMLFDIRHADITKITTFAPTHFVFTDITNKTSDFEQVGTNLLKNGNILADSLQNANGVQFTYLDPNGNAASAATAICRVKIRLNFQKGDQTLSFDSETRIRNL
jgi:prepilin-type N-terminal cleavage/methylation domain-containing protein